MMKNLLTIILMATVVLTACTKGDTTVTEPAVDRIVTINAIIAGNTKVALGKEDEKKVNWTTGDIINLTINNVAYPFTWQEGTTFAYSGDATLPALTQDLQITASYAPEFSKIQTGLKADVGNYMALFAEKTVTTEISYGDVNLAFSHGTSVLKLTLRNNDFKGNNVTDIALKSGSAILVTATSTFVGDTNDGSVIAYFAIQPAQLQDVTVNATCNAKEYVATMSSKELIGGKLYNGSVEVALSNNYIDEYGINHGPGVEIDGVIWAPVNCGYHKDDFKYGKLYQWGRKYGQGYDGNLYDFNGNNVGEYSDEIVPVSQNGPVSKSTGESKENENYFYRINSSPWDWLSSKDDDMWNSGSESKPVKTEYDPCPEGWRVPSLRELSKLCENYSSWTLNDTGQAGYWFSGSSSYASKVPQIFLLAAGTIASYMESSSRGYKGQYWSSTSGSSTYHYYASSIYFKGGKVEDGYLEQKMDRSSGLSVRCVHE